MNSTNLIKDTVSSECSVKIEDTTRERIRLRITQVAVAVASDPSRKPRRQGNTAQVCRGGSEVLATIRLANVNKILDLRHEGRADHLGKWFLHEMVASLFCALDGWPDNFRSWARVRLPTLDPNQIEALIADSEESPRAWDSAAAGSILRLSTIDRERLRAWSLAPFDQTQAEREATQKARRAEAERQRRRKAGAKQRGKSILLRVLNALPKDGSAISRSALRACLGYQLGHTKREGEMLRRALVQGKAGGILDYDREKARLVLQPPPNVPAII